MSLKPGWTKNKTLTLNNNYKITKLIMVIIILRYEDTCSSISEY